MLTIHIDDPVHNSIPDEEVMVGVKRGIVFLAGNASAAEPLKNIVTTLINYESARESCLEEGVDTQIDINSRVRATKNFS